jgi:RNA polymerase sigma factor (sigma-70 family)
MQTNKKGEVTALLMRWNKKDPEALNDLFPLVFRELNAVASQLLRSKPAGYICDPRELVNELYMRLVDGTSIAFPERRFFFYLAGQAMRDILVDDFRRRHASKRSGSIRKEDIDEIAGFGQCAAAESDGRQRVSLPDSLRQLPREMTIDFLLSQDLMERLKKMDGLQYEIVLDRVLAGRTVEEIAEYMNIPEIKVKREYKLAIAWLSREAVKGQRTTYGRVGPLAT